MDLSGLRETISTRGKIFPARSRMVGSVKGKSIMVPRIVPLGRVSDLSESYHHLEGMSEKREEFARRQIVVGGRTISGCKRGQFPRPCNRPLMSQSRARGGSAFPDCP